FPGEDKPILLLQTQFSESGSRVSPDGHWLAYTSTESGSSEDYIVPFTPGAPGGTGGKRLISRNGGNRPVWGTDSGQLFFASQGQLMVVDIDTTKAFQASAPRRLFTSPGVVSNTGWDISPDGKRFLIPALPSAGHVAFTVILNWQAGLKK